MRNQGSDSDLLGLLLGLLFWMGAPLLRTEASIPGATTATAEGMVGSLLPPAAEAVLVEVTGEDGERRERFADKEGRFSFPQLKDQASR